MRLLLPGLLALRAYWRVVLGIQVAAAACVLLYFTVPAVRDFCSHLAHAKASGGIAFAAAANLVSGGILPEILKWRLRPPGLPRPSTAELVHQAALFVILGVLIDVFYGLQTRWFGDSNDLRTLATKVFVDQFICTPLLTVPLVVSWFAFRERHWNPLALLSGWSPRLWLQRCLPLWVSVLGYWIPVLCAIYALPADLQFVAYLFVNCAWAILMIFIARRQATPPAASSA